MEEHYNELLEVISKSLREDDHICKYHKHECPINKDCDECVKDFMLDFVDTLHKVEFKNRKSSE